MNHHPWQHHLWTSSRGPSIMATAGRPSNSDNRSSARHPTAVSCRPLRAATSHQPSNIKRNQISALSHQRRCLLFALYSLSFINNAHLSSYNHSTDRWDLRSLTDCHDDFRFLCYVHIKSFVLQAIMEGWEDLVLQCRRYRGERSVLESWGGRDDLGCEEWEIWRDRPWAIII